MFFFRKKPVIKEIVPPPPAPPPPPKITTYWTLIHCKNCGTSTRLVIKKGKTEEEHKNENKNKKCEYCDSLISLLRM